VEIPDTVVRVEDCREVVYPLARREPEERVAISPELWRSSVDGSPRLAGGVRERAVVARHAELDH
jgi:hypothetical protein